MNEVSIEIDGIFQQRYAGGQRAILGEKGNGKADLRHVSASSCCTRTVGESRKGGRGRLFHHP
jgi:hypothetical protein